MVVSAVNSQTVVQSDLKHVNNYDFSGTAGLASETGHNQPPLLLLCYLMFLCVPLLLFTFRWFDDNRLVSWVWAC